MIIENTVALVTGAAQGVGASCVRALLAAGVRRVVAADLRSPETDDSRVLAVQLDVTDEARVRELVAGMDEAIQIAVNCAGMYRFRDGVEIALEDWNRSLAVNLTAPFAVIKHVSGRLRAEALPGAIVNVASIAGKRGFPNQADYCSAKAGLIGLTRAAALDLAPFGITVNAVAPGTVDTPMMQSVVRDLSAITGLDDAEQRRALTRDIPIGRMQTPDEIAAAIAFLAFAPAITGETLVVDGGLTRD